MNSSTTCGAHLLHDVPKTIEDAMFVANKLGIPQLWVDQYCINQPAQPRRKHSND
jgi:hypothetical protein